MRHLTKYFVLNKDSDFAGGSRYNIDLLSPGITLHDVREGEGYFFSGILDSREKQTQWHRLVTDADTAEDTSIRLWVYAGEERTFLRGDEKVDIGGLLEDSSVPPGEKQRLLLPYLVKSASDPGDILLHEVQGRYVWLCIRLAAQGAVSPAVRKVKVFFPKNTWLRYLPEVYQQDKKSASFVERYLGIFQSLYQDMEEKISLTPKYLDPDAVQGDFVKWLASWIGVEDTYLWNESQLKYLLRHGMELYRIRGTVRYMKEMVKLFTGKTPYIVEQHQTALFSGNYRYAEKLALLYGENSSIFTVIVDMDSRVSPREYQILMRIVERACPAHMESRIIVLEPYIFLDRYSYMGINSVLGSYSAFVLDGQASIPFSTLGEKEETA